MKTIQRFLSASATLLLAAAAPLAAQPLAGDCLIGPQLGASLLFPYFEVEADDPGGMTTSIAINNGYHDPRLARVVLWSDWGNPVLAFDVYLGRFDIVTINLRDVMNGVIPSTGAGADLSAFPFCGSLPPTHTNPVLSESGRAQLVNRLTGKSDPPLANTCYGENHDDGRPRGYITVDAVRECSGVSVGDVSYAPNDTTYPYFGNGATTGIASYDNALYGDIVYIDPSENLADGSEAVVLWADPTRFNTSPVFTFYGRFSGYDGRDHRVPLPNIWNMRFLNGGPFVGGASAIVYHDPGAPAVGAASCNTGPSTFPLPGLISVTDEDGHTLSVDNSLPMSLATRKTSVSGLGLPYAAGFLQLTTVNSQMWVQAVLSARTRFSLGFNATPVAFLCGETPVL